MNAMDLMDAMEKHYAMKRPVRFVGEEHLSIVSILSIASIQNFGSMH